MGTFVVMLKAQNLGRDGGEEGEGVCRFRGRKANKEFLSKDEENVCVCVCGKGEGGSKR